ncbi:MAG: PASTA domain-containing protein [Bacteroidia bacterium]
MSRIKNFITSKMFLLNLLGAAAFFIMFFGFTYKWLNSYTNHGSTVTVPDLRGLKVATLQNFLKDKALRIKIADSSVFDLEKPPGTVIEQDPAPAEKVKENRTIYLTITKTVPPKIKMPNLIDVSYRQAEAILLSYGLKAGQTSYKPDLCKNCVLSFTLNGKTLKPGDELTKGTVIDLTLGDGFGNTKVSVPQLYGLSLDEALFVLKGSSLNSGSVIFDSSVKDSIKAMVYKQNPAYGSASSIREGEGIDIYLTQSESVLKDNEPK